MFKYFEVYCINKYGDTFIIDVGVDVFDVLEYMSCNIMTCTDETIEQYIIMMFKKFKPQYYIDIVVPLDYTACSNEPRDLMAFLKCSC